GGGGPALPGPHDRARLARLDLRRLLRGPLPAVPAPARARATRPPRGDAARGGGLMALKKWLDTSPLRRLFDGLSAPGRHLLKKKVTIEYPEQKKLPSDRFRGMFRLDEERCIKCTLCAIECPINIIYIDWHNEKNEAGKSEKVLDRFDVDLKRCMFCQLC